MMLIYIAGPIRKGDQALNVRQAIDAADQIMKAGHAPFCPHLSLFWHMHHPHEHEEWMAYNYQVLARCDALVRLPGRSDGADDEVRFANEHGIPVFDGVEDLFWLCEQAVAK